MGKNINHIEVDDTIIVCNDDILAASLCSEEYNVAKKRSERKIDKIMRSVKPKRVDDAFTEGEDQRRARDRLYNILKDYEPRY